MARRIKWNVKRPQSICLTRRYNCYKKLVDDLTKMAEARHEDVTFMAANILTSALKDMKAPKPPKEVEDEIIYYVPVELL